MANNENVLLTNKHLLICIDNDNDNDNIDCPYKMEYNYIKKNFCGIILSNHDELNTYFTNNNIIHGTFDDVIIYLCGNIKQIYEEVLTYYDYYYNSLNTQIVGPSAN